MLNVAQLSQSSYSMGLKGTDITAEVVNRTLGRGGFACMSSKLSCYLLTSIGSRTCVSPINLVMGVFEDPWDALCAAHIWVQQTNAL